MSNSAMFNWNRVLGTCAIAAWISTGCGGSPHGGHPSGSVEVTVTFGGEPVTEGEVLLSSSETGLGGGGPLGPDGRGRIASVPVGEYTVTVVPPPPDMTDPDPVQKEYPNLPKPFRSEATSPLKATVTEGTNSFSFDLQEE